MVRGIYSSIPGAEMKILPGVLVAFVLLAAATAKAETEEDFANSLPRCDSGSSAAVCYPDKCIQPDGEIWCARLHANSTGIVSQSKSHCVDVANRSTNDYFIPMRKTSELNDFLDSAPGIRIVTSQQCQGSQD